MTNYYTTRVRSGLYKFKVNRYIINKLLNKNEINLFNYLDKILKEIKNTYGVKNKGGLFTSKIRKINQDLIRNLNYQAEKEEKIQLEKENLRNKEEEEQKKIEKASLTLSKFNSLKQEYKDKVEKIAIEEFMKNANANLDFLMQMKKTSDVFYYKTLSMYLETAMLSLEKAE